MDVAQKLTKIYVSNFGDVIGTRTLKMKVHPLMTTEQLKSAVKKHLKRLDPTIDRRRPAFMYSGERNPETNDNTYQKKGLVMWNFFRINNMDAAGKHKCWIEGVPRQRIYSGAPQPAPADEENEGAEEDEGAENPFSDDAVAEDDDEKSSGLSEYDNIDEDTWVLDQQPPNVDVKQEIDSIPRSRSPEEIQADIDTLREKIDDELDNYARIDRRMKKRVDSRIAGFLQWAENYEHELKEQQYDLHRKHYSKMLNFMERQQILMKCLAETSDMPGGLNDETKKALSDFFEEMDAEKQDFHDELAEIDRKLISFRRRFKEEQRDLVMACKEVDETAAQNLRTTTRVIIQRDLLDKAALMMDFARKTGQPAKEMGYYLELAQEKPQYEDLMQLKIKHFMTEQATETAIYADYRVYDLNLKLKIPGTGYCFRGHLLHESLTLKQMGITDGTELVMMNIGRGGGREKAKKGRTKTRKSRKVRVVSETEPEDDAETEMLHEDDVWEEPAEKENINVKAGLKDEELEVMLAKELAVTKDNVVPAPSLESVHAEIEAAIKDGVPGLLQKAPLEQLEHLNELLPSLQKCKNFTHFFKHVTLCLLKPQLTAVRLTVMRYQAARRAHLITVVKSYFQKYGRSITEKNEAFGNALKEVIDARTAAKARLEARQELIEEQRAAAAAAPAAPAAPSDPRRGVLGFLPGTR